MNEHLIKITCSQQCNFAVNVFDSPKIPHLRIWEFAQGAPWLRFSQTEKLLRRKMIYIVKIILFNLLMYCSQTKRGLRNLPPFQTFFSIKRFSTPQCQQQRPLENNISGNFATQEWASLQPTMCRTQQFAFIPPVDASSISFGFMNRIVYVQCATSKEEASTNIL